MERQTAILLDDVLLTAYELTVTSKLPGNSQIQQTLPVAICSGAIATTLFFFATDKVRNDQQSLAAAETTQSTEVLFALAGEILVLNITLPDIYGLVGMLLIISGMVLHSLWKHN